MESKNIIEGKNEGDIKNVGASPEPVRVRLWDLPTRLFHWLLVLAVLTSFATGWIGGEWMGVHGKSGLVIIGLIIFRVVWGFVGPTYVRFLNFVPSPKKVRAYLKGQWQGIGHNPLGALSVLALLGSFALQAGTGLFANDDIDFTGPLYALVDEATSNQLTRLHHLLPNFLIGLVVLHVMAILFFTWFKKNDLIGPMVTGWKKGVSETSSTRVSIIALLVAVSIALAVVYAVSGAR